MNDNGIKAPPDGSEVQREMRPYEKAIEWEGEARPFLDLTQPYRTPDFTFEYQGVPFAPLTGIQALTGQSGHGKTMTFSLLIAAALSGNYGGLRWVLPRDVKEARVMYVDTEMEYFNTLTVTQRICQMAGLSPRQAQERLGVLALREEASVEKMWRVILANMKAFKPAVVFLDGLLDLVKDFNKNDECQEVIRNVMGMAVGEGVSIWGLVHENPGSQKMVGHIGSMLERKSTDIFVTTKERTADGILFNVRHSKARGKDVPNLYFRVLDTPGSNLAVPVISDLYESPAPKSEAPSVEQVLAEGEAVSTNVLKERIKQHFHVGTAEAEKCIRQAVEDGTLRRERFEGKGGGWLHSLNIDDTDFWDEHDDSDSNPF